MRARPYALLILVVLVPALLLAARAAAEEGAQRIAAADPLQGKTALIRKGCITCHSIWGVGGKLAPDLATAASDYSFQQMASTFWNHTPRMVGLLKQRGMEWPALSEQEMADIISFVYYLQLLDRPGDAARGRAMYREKKCDSCHPTSSGGRRRSHPLSEYGSFISSVHLAQAMWNSGRAMREAQKAQGIAMPLFAGREMADLQAYLRGQRSSPEARTDYLPLPDINRGKTLFRTKGCSRCHAPGGPAPDLSRQPLRKSISEICGVLWNHSFAMQSSMAAAGVALPRLEGNDLADLLGYIYFLHFSRDSGNAERGSAVFREKGCAGCHALGGPGSKGAPELGGEEGLDTLSLATSMWNHAPIMHEAMESEVMKWIKLDPDDIQDISRFLQRLRSQK